MRRPVTDARRVSRHVLVTGYSVLGAMGQVIGTTLAVCAWLFAVAGCNDAASEASSTEALRAAVRVVEAGETDRIELELAEGEFTDADLALVEGLAGLKRLKLKPTRISDAGLVHLQGLTGLETLNLSGTDVTDEGLASLAGLTYLELLRLGSSRVVGPGLAHLAGMSEMRHLILQQAPLTDEGLPHLKGLSKLESLYVEGTQVTDDGIDDLLKTFPHLHVHPHR